MFMSRVKSQFSQNRSGSTAVEFAIICPLIIALTIGTFEVGLSLYERNRLSAASSAGARQIVLTGTADDSAIEAAIRDAYKDDEQSDLQVIISTETISAHKFKKIQVTYNYDLIIGFGRFKSLVLTNTRYAAGA